MDDRIIEFIRGLRAAGVRVSVAESADALRAVEALGILDKALFRESLRTTLVKDVADFAAFDNLFPLYFGSGGPPLQNASEELSPDEQEMLKAALAALSGRLQQLLQWLTSGQGPTREELEEMARRAGAQLASNPQDAYWVTRRTLRQMGFAHLEEMLQELAQRLREMGMSQPAMEQLMGVIEANREALAEQVAQQVGWRIAQDRAERLDDLHGSDLMHKSFETLTENEANVLRTEVQRLVSQLRSRAALRQKRGRTGRLDAKSTIRASQRYGGVPFEVKYKKRKLKPRLVLICDVSTSMRPVAEFLLRLVYELHDQVAHARSFAFINDMHEISPAMASGRNAVEAVDNVLRDHPAGYYNTDLGHSLNSFFARWLDSVSHRTTVIVLGDGRNNYNAPRLDLVRELQKRARRLIWLTPEHREQWGTGDSDMLEYAPVCDKVYQVRNLAQLSAAVDRLLAGG